MARWTSARARRAVPEVTVTPEPDFDWSWTEDGPNWVAPTIDTTVPSIARIYNYVLGGKDNFGVDREAAEQVREFVPDLADLAHSNREFVLRAATVMAEAGIDQFLDLGCGIPSWPTVHEVVRPIVPGARVAYVDHDPIVVAHVRAILDGQPGLGAFMHDLRDPARVMHDPRLCELVHFDRPIGLIMGAVLHFVDLTLAPQIAGRYLDRLVPGSHAAFSMAAIEGLPEETLHNLDQVMRSVGAPVSFRTHAQVEEVVDGMRLLPPGITDVSQWRADGLPGSVRIHAGVAVR